MRVYEEQPDFGAGETQMKFVSYDVGIWQGYARQEGRNHKRESVSSSTDTICNHVKSSVLISLHIWMVTCYKWFIMMIDNNS